MRHFVGFVTADPDRIPRKGPWGWKAIRWFQGWPHYEHGAKVHVFNIFENDGLEVFETTNTIYRHTTLADRSNGTPVDVFLMPTDGSEAYERAFSLVGNPTPYGWSNIAGHGPRLLADKCLNLPRQWMGKEFIPSQPSRNPWRLPGTKYCTEVTLDNMMASGIVTPWAGIHAGVLCHVLYPWMLKHYELVAQTNGERITEL